MYQSYTYIFVQFAHQRLNLRILQFVQLFHFFHFSLQNLNRLPQLLYDLLLLRQLTRQLPRVVHRLRHHLQVLLLHPRFLLRLRLRRLVALQLGVDVVEHLLDRARHRSYHFFDVIAMDLEVHFAENFFVEGFPVDVLGGGGVGGLVVVELYHVGEMILDDFGNEHTVREIAGDIFGGAAKWNSVDPLEYFFGLLFVDGGGLHYQQNYNLLYYVLCGGQWVGGGGLAPQNQKPLSITYQHIKNKKMAIYSGFSNRKLQDRYNQLLSDTINLLSQVIITYVERSKLAPFETQFAKFFTNLEKLDQIKHSQPKFSNFLKSLNHHINLLEEVCQQPEEQRKNHRKRPMTTNNYTQRRSSLDYERKTINTLPININKLQKPVGKKERYSFSQQEKEKREDIEQKPNQTMQELMQKNRLVQRKMSIFRKKKYMQGARIQRIQELEEEQNQVSFF